MKVSTARNVGRSSGCVRRWACGLPYPASGRRSHPSVVLHICFLTGAPRRRRPGRCPPFHVPIPPATSTDCPAASNGGRRGFPSDSPARRPGADDHCASPVVLPRTLPRPFLERHCRHADRPQAAMGSHHWPGTAPGPAGDRPPPSRPRRRSNSNHVGKSTYSGEIESLNRDPGIATLDPGMRFPGN